jgi:hypothetical protein
MMREGILTVLARYSVAKSSAILLLGFSIMVAYVFAPNISIVLTGNNLDQFFFGKFWPLGLFVAFPMLVVFFLQAVVIITHRFVAVVVDGKYLIYRNLFGFRLSLLDVSGISVTPYGGPSYFKGAQLIKLGLSNGSYRTINTELFSSSSTKLSDSIRFHVDSLGVTQG